MEYAELDAGHFPNGFSIFFILFICLFWEFFEFPCNKTHLEEVKPLSAFSIGATLLDAMVLALLTKEDTYGYQITKDIQNTLPYEPPCIRAAPVQKLAVSPPMTDRIKAETAAITASPSPAERCWISTGKTGSPISNRWTFSWTRNNCSAM